MLDLEHLDALDDDTPPEPDLASARVRAHRLRARHRWTAVAAAVVVLGGAAVTVAALRGNDHSVQVVGPSGTTSVPPTPEQKPAVSGTLPNGVKITLTLDTPTVLLGEDIHATVVLHNNTAETKTLGTDPIQCALDVAPELRDANDKIVFDGENGIGCYDIGLGLPAGGVRTIDVTVPTKSVVIPPAQRDGQYSLSLESVGSAGGPQPAWALGPVPVKIVMPEGITARLELPKTTYPADTSVDGTILFVNGTGRPVDYHIDCTRKQPWDVLLSKDGVLFEGPQAAVGCAANSGTTAHLAPGPNRIPFYVNLGYPGCENAPGSPSVPVCTGDPPGTPDLPPGRYQLVFRGTDAPFQSLVVPPLDVDVVARSPHLAINNLPRITAATVKGAQLEFQRLYLASDAPYRGALIDRGVTVLFTASMGDRLVIQIPTSPRADDMRTSLLSLFEHPELVTVAEGDPGSSGRS